MNLYRMFYVLFNVDGEPDGVHIAMIKGDDAADAVQFAFEDLNCEAELLVVLPGFESVT